MRQRFDRMSITASPVALDYYPGGLTVVDPYQNYPTWYVDAVNGTDTGSPGVDKQAAGYTYKTYDNALLDVFYIGNPGQRRIVVKPTGTYLPGGALSANRGSYFPAGGPDANHLCVLQGDPSNSTLPTIDPQLGGCSNITGITLGAVNTTVTFGDPISGASRQPFAAGEMVQFANITGTTQLNGQIVTVVTTGGSAGAWSITFVLNSLGYTAWISGGQVWNGGAGQSPICLGNQGGFGTTATTTSNVVIRKLEMVNSVTNSVYLVCPGGASGAISNVTIEYCSFHGNRYPYSNPGASGAIGFERPENAFSGVTIRYCKFYDIGTRPGQLTTSTNSDWNTNCVPFETYGCDNVTISNCSFKDAYIAIRQKLFNNAVGAGGSGNGSNGGGTNNNMTVQNCIFTNNYEIFSEGTGSSLFNATTNFTFTGNLCYGPKLNVTADNQALGLGVAGNPNTTGNTILIVNNTFGEDITFNAFSWAGATGVTVRDNVFLDQRHTLTYNSTDAGNTAQAPIVFSQLDYNVYGLATGSVTGVWWLGYGNSAGIPLYKYTSFAQWQAANTSPLDNNSNPTSPAPPDLATTGNPDPHGIWIPNLSSSWNTTAKNMADATYAADGNYTLIAGSPLLTSSSTGGRIGYDPTNSGPGW